MTYVPAMYGFLKSGYDLEQAVIRHLRGDLPDDDGDHPGWMTAYIAEIERQLGLDPKTIPVIKSYVTANEFRKWPEEQTPAILVVSPGLTDPPKKEGDGTYRGSFSLGVAAIAKGRTKQETQRTAKVYGAAIAGAMVQHPSLQGFARGLGWRDQSYTDIDSDEGRTLASSQNIFEIEVGNLVQAFGGPVVVPEDPYVDPGSWPEAKEGGVKPEVQQQGESEP